VFKKHLKWFLVGLYLLGGGCFVLFVLAIINVIPGVTGNVTTLYLASLIK